MKPSRTLLLAVGCAVTLAASPRARACSVCGCGDPILAASDPAAISGRLRLQLDTELLRIDAGTDGQPGYVDQLTQWSYRLGVAYRPWEPLSLVATLPVVSRSIRTAGGGASELDSDLTGLGDLEVAARYALHRWLDLLHDRVYELALTGGSSFPTGRHDARAADGGLVDPHGQLGTGGFGPFLGLTFLFEHERWLAFAALSGRLRTEARYLDGSRYKFGNALLWSVHGQYRPIRRLALDLGLDGRTARADRATSSDGSVEPAVANTGGTVLSAAPGLYLDAGGRFWIFLRGQIPFYSSLFGEQRVYPAVTAGLQLEIL